MGREAVIHAYECCYKRYKSGFLYMVFANLKEETLTL